MSNSKRKKNEPWADLEDWGDYMAAKKAKLEEQFDEAAQLEVDNPTDLFKGIAIFINGYTNPTGNEIRRLMMENGGIYHHYLRPRITTHIIASNLPYSKIVVHQKSKNPLPICKPEWLCDSLKAGKLLDYKKYLLYTPASIDQQRLQFTTKEREEDLERPGPSGMSLGANKAAVDTSPLSMESQIIEERNEAIAKSVEASHSAMCTKNSQFLSEFYSNSRLHHISTMGTMFKDYVNQLREKNKGVFPGLEKLKERKSSDDTLVLSGLDDMESEYGRSKNIIMHIDMDCFFVSVGLRNHPELRGLPVAVAHAKGNKPNSRGNDQGEYGSMSEIASCSYEARKAGLKNGMFLGQALKLCPNLKVIEYNFEGYTEVSYALYNTVASYTLSIEAVSCDEMYVECSKVLSETGLTPLEFADVLRSEIKEITGCPVSTGFGANKLQARLATKKAKPDGKFHLSSADAESFIADFNVRDLPGVGYSIAKKLKSRGIDTCRDMQEQSLGYLQKEFSRKTGETLYNMCRGIDNSKLNLDHVRKSVSAEVNYGIRFGNDREAEEFLNKLSAEVSDRLKKANLKGKCLTLKLMVRAKDAAKDPAKFMGHGVCDYFTKSANIIAPVDDPAIITREVMGLWRQMQQPADDIRGVGIQMSKLENLKSKGNPCLLNFIAKGKEAASSTRNVVNIPERRVHEIEQPKSKEPKDLKAYFTGKNSGNNPMTETGARSRVPARENVLQLSQEIDESVLRELPESIRKEIISTNVQIVKPKEKKLSQTKQESYFKQTKPNVKSGKAKMPAIEEIDMSVLIELPEDVRNEILNEYRKDKQVNNAPTKAPVKQQHQKSNPISEDLLTFSQVDSEFMNALSEDLKEDVKLYFMAKKQKDKTNAKPSVSTPMTEKSKPKISTASKTKVAIQQTRKSSEATNKNLKKSVLVTKDEVMEYKRAIAECDSIVVKNEDTLYKIVNHMFSLAFDMVKNQITKWVTSYNAVNEMDYLSITIFLSILPKKRMLEELHILLRTLHRCTMKSENCVWHETYRKIVKHVQRYMWIEYNSDLMTPQIKCNFLKCK